MKKIMILLLGCCLLSGMAGESRAYDDDMHFYMVQWMCKEMGFDHEIADIIALSNQETDDSARTEPLGYNTYSDANNERRRNWHFPGLLHKKCKGVATRWGCAGGKVRYYENTRQNNYYGLYNVVLAERTRGRNPYLMGMALHVYMDTYAHEGYGGRFGHAAAGYDPDRPYLEKHRDKTRKMLDFTYSQLVNYALDRARVVGKKKSILDGAWSIISSYDTKIDNPDDTVKWDYLPLTRLHGKVMAMRVKAWGGKNLQKDMDSARAAVSWQDSDWVKEAFDKYHLPWKVETLASMNKQSTPSAANDFVLPKTIRYKQEFAVDYCQIYEEYDLSLEEKNAVVLDILINNPDMLLDSRFYPGKYAGQIECARALVSTRTGLEMLMAYVGDDGSGMLQESRNMKVMQIFPAIAWSREDLRAVLSPYLSSPHKDRRLMAAWALHFYGIGDREKLFVVFDDTYEEEIRAKNSNSLDGDSKVSQFLPIAEEYLEIWADYFRYGSPEEVAQGAFSLYTIATDPGDSARNSFISPGRLSALETLRQGSGVNSGVESESALNAVDYWRLRSFEDIDDRVSNSSMDKKQIQCLIDSIRSGINAKNNRKIIAAAIAASTYSPEDHADRELLKALQDALVIDDPVLRAEVGYAFQQITGNTMDLSWLGLKVIKEEVDAIMKKKI